MTSIRSLSRRSHGWCKQLVAALVAAGVLASVAACGGGNGQSTAGPAPSLPAVCSPVRSPTVQQALHIADGKTATYNSTPPTSGEHYARPIVAGIYAVAVPNERQVHNLEHGHVMVQYRDLTDEQAAELEAIVRANEKQVVMAPYPGMDPRVALTSWGKIQTCDAWDEAVPALAAHFIKAYRDNAPESLP